MQIKKISEFYEYVGMVAFLNEKDVKRYALSIGNLQLHTKEDFHKTLEVLRFLMIDKEFKIPKKIKIELKKKFEAMFRCSECGSKKIGITQDGKSRYIIHKINCISSQNPATASG